MADPHHLLELEERKRLINESLSLLGNTGAQVIRLHYLEGLRDEEVVRQKLTPYTTVDSLKTKRSRYMKKLASVIDPSGFWY